MIIIDCRVQCEVVNQKDVGSLIIWAQSRVAPTNHNGISLIYILVILTWYTFNNVSGCFNVVELFSIIHGL